MKLKSLLLVTITVTGLTLTGCKNNKENGDILKPIAKNLVGYWDYEASYSHVDGNWQEEEMDDMAGFTVNFRADSTVCWIITNPDLRTYMVSGKWTANDDTNELILNGKSKKIQRLTADEYVHSDTIAFDTETNNYVTGEFRWTMKRIDTPEKNLAEQLIGKWRVTNTYEKIDGEWQKTNFGMPDEGTQEYREDGICAYYSRVGDLENSYEMDWSINMETGELLWTVDGSYISATTIVLESADTMACYYTTNYDIMTEASKTGEFKDIFVRE